MFMLGTVTDCYFAQWKGVIRKFALGGKGTISQKLLKTVLQLKLRNLILFTRCIRYCLARRQTGTVYA